MAEDLHAELTTMMGPVQWEWLKPHVQRDSVVIVNPDLDLAEVGVAIATDNTQAVARWINEQLILKPNAEQLVEWSRDNKCLISLIVQPYVLVQDQPETSAASFLDSSTDSSTDSFPDSLDSSQP